LSVSDDYHVLFLQGGASTQFAMVPMNLLPAARAPTNVTPVRWSEKALEEAKIVGTVRVAATTAVGGKYTRIPKQSELELDPNAAYVHITSNNTLFGTEWFDFPDTRKSRSSPTCRRLHVAQVRLEPLRPRVRGRAKRTWPERHRGRPRAKDLVEAVADIPRSSAIRRTRTNR